MQVTCQVDDVLEAMPQVEALIQGLDSHEGRPRKGTGRSLGDWGVDGPGSRDSTAGRVSHPSVLGVCLSGSGVCRRGADVLV